MDKREMLDRLAANGDERLLLGRVWDKYEQCRRRNLPQGTGFLSPAEQAAAQRLLNALSVSEGYTFWGGYLLIILPSVAVSSGLFPSLLRCTVCR